MIRVYNTLGGKKEDFKPLDGKNVKMYCCGPTVYDFLHCGNFRGPVFYNFLKNWLTRQGYNVTYVYNFTDVDDKIINRAKEESKTPQEIANTYTKEFWNDFNALELTPHDCNPKVTETMPEIIALVERLIAAGKAYAIDGDVFFSVGDFEEYGKLTGKNTDELESGHRVEPNPKKRNELDFALWKSAKEGEQGWSSPWGLGRPGWHIECTAMIHKHLGEQIDIHGGGLDLTFPHHENEIAQSQGATGKPYVKYWLHNNMFTFDGKKMSKSLGNIRTMRSFLERFPPEVFKYLTLSVHYRTVADFSDSSIQRSIAGLARIYSALAVADHVLSSAGGIEPATSPNSVSSEIAEAIPSIEKSLNDDFNTPEAFARFFEIVRKFNSEVRRGKKVSSENLAKAKALKTFFSDMGNLFALFQQEPNQFLKDLDDLLLKQKNLDRSAIQSLVTTRNVAREDKDWAKSDQLRDELVGLGIELQDLPSGTHWEVKK